MIKKLMSLFLILLIMPVITSSAVSIAAETSDVYDYAGLFADNGALQSAVDEFKEQTGWNIAVVTADDAKGKSSMAYADDFYDENYGPNTDGVLYLIDMDNRQNYISTSGEAILYFDDYTIERVLDSTTPNLGNGDYDKAALAFLSSAESYYSKGIPDSNSNYTINSEGAYVRSESTSEIKGLLSNINWVVVSAASIIAALIFAVCVIFRYKRVPAPGACCYLDSKETYFRDKQDVFLREYTTSVVISDGGSSGSGGGGSSTHSSSGGGCHGGGGRGF